MPDLFKLIPDPKCMAANIGAAAEQAFKPVERPFIAPCKLLERAGFSHGFPEPGDPRFCGVLEDTIPAFEGIADKANDWLSYLNIAKDIANGLHLQESDDPLLKAYNLVVRLWNGLLDRLADVSSVVIQNIINILKEALNIHSCIVPEKYRKAHQGVWILKQLVHLFENIRAGIDPGIWVTVDIHPQFDLIKAWLDKVENYFAPIQIAGPQETTRAWLFNRISTGHRNCIWRLHGIDPANYENIALSEREQLDWRNAIQYLRRQGLGEGDEDAELRARGFVTEHDRAMAKEMYWELPGIADHLHWLQRNVFDTDYVRDYRLLEGFDTRFWPKFGDNLKALGMREEYAQLHYAAHWVMPSPEQMQRFLYRSEEIAGATGKGFTLEDYSRILAEQDYNPLVRQWFTATAYQVPAISYIKEWFRQGVIDRAKLSQYHRFLGFNPDDADNFVKIDEVQKMRLRTTQTHGWTTKAATDAWVNGQIPEERQEALYVTLGYTVSEATNARQVALTAVQNRIITRARSRVSMSVMTSIRSALLAGIIGVQDARDMLVQAGWPKDMAFAYASTQGVEARTRSINAAITYLKRMVLQGVISFPTAAAELATLGVDTFAAQQYLTVWRLQLTPGRRRRSSKEIVNDLATGHIDRPTAQAMLVNLGYTDVDVLLYLADATEKISKLIAQRKAASDRAGLQRAKAQAALVRQHQKEAKDIIRGMMREIPVAKLMKWAKTGIIGKDFFHKRMVLYGYLNDDIERYYSEACEGKTSKCKDTTPGFDGTPGTNGGGGSATK